MPDEGALRDLENSFNGKKKDPFDQFSMSLIRDDEKNYYYRSGDGVSSGIVIENKKTGKRKYVPDSRFRR